jgi:hypothetical protein
MIAVSQDRFLIRRRQVDAHPAVSPDFDLAGLRGTVVYHHRHLGALDAGCQALKLALLAIDLLEDFVQIQGAGGKPGPEPERKRYAAD